MVDLTSLGENGFALVPRYLRREETDAIRGMYADPSLFRSRVVMQRHAFGHGEYQYFANPLPGPIAAIRGRLYAELSRVANSWMQELGIARRFPSTHRAFLEECAAEGQSKPTALLLRYVAGDYNCLHHDLYGPVAFPFQATIYLSEPAEEFSGGEVVLTERRPRAQVRAHVLSPRCGDLLVLPVDTVPRRSERGIYRVHFKHGISTVTAGERYALGIIFHDAV